MNWKPIKDVPTEGYLKELLLYTPKSDKYRVGYAFPIDEECNRSRIMFIVGLDFLQTYDEPTHFANLTEPV